MPNGLKDAMLLNRAARALNEIRRNRELGGEDYRAVYGASVYLGGLLEKTNDGNLVEDIFHVQRERVQREVGGVISCVKVLGKVCSKEEISVNDLESNIEYLHNLSSRVSANHDHKYNKFYEATE